MAEIPSVEPGVPGRDDRPGLLVRTPYDERLVEELKSQIPRPDRYWNPEGEGAWWVAEEHEELVMFLLHQHWPEVMVCGAEGEPDLLVGRGGVVFEQGRLAL